MKLSVLRDFKPSLITDRKEAERYFNSQKVASKFDWLLTIPQIVIVLLAAVIVIIGLGQVIEKYRQYQIVNLSLSLADVAHNFAVERGLSAGFLGSKGTASNEKLLQQRQKNEAIVEAFISSVQDIEGYTRSQTASANLKELQSLLTKRKVVRDGIDALSSDTGFFTFYSSINALSLGMVDHLGMYFDDPSTIANYHAFNKLMWLKERAGQERGALNGVFAANNYNGAQAKAVTGYINDQNQLFSEFAAVAPEAKLSSLNSKLSSKEVEQVLALRKTFLDNLEIRNLLDTLAVDAINGQVNYQIISQLNALLQGDPRQTQVALFQSSLSGGEIGLAQLRELSSIAALPNIDNSAWFAAATSRISGVNGVKDDIADELKNGAMISIAFAVAYLLFTLVSAYAAYRLSNYIGNVVVNNISTGLEKIRAYFDTVSTTFDFNTNFSIEGNDEIAETGNTAHRLLLTIKGTFDDITQMSAEIAKGRFKGAKLSKGYKGDIDLLAKDLTKSVNQIDEAFGAIEASMQKASDGNFDQQINQPMLGQLEQLKSSINSMLLETSQSLSDIGSQVSELANGELKTLEESHYKGQLRDLVQGNNQTIEQLKTILERDVKSLLDAASRGQLSQRIDTNDKNGIFEDLAVSINQLVADNQSFTQELNAIFAKLSRGNLDAELAGKFQGDFATLQQNINETVDAISRIIESEIEEVVTSAVAGDLSQRIDTSDKAGCFEDLAVKINSLMDTNEAAINDVNVYLAGLAKGDLSVRIKNDFPGKFRELRDNANATATVLDQIISEDIQNVIEAIENGNLESEVGLEGKLGSFHELAEGINNIVSITNAVISEISHVLEGLASGDLTQKMAGKYAGTFARLAKHTNKSMDKLQYAMENVSSIAGSVQSGSEEIAQANSSLSTTIASQASAIEQTTAAITELTSRIKDNRDEISETEQLVKQVTNSANQAKVIAEAALQSMREVASSSQRIEQIISVIDEISFQTNLLALNAAVEAARAGEHGRGFAVVASEVRNLAQRSASSASEIKSIITESVKVVNEGSDQVEKSAESSTDISEYIENVKERISRVAGLIREQEMTASEMLEAVREVDSGLQQNSSTVEQVSAASKSLADEAIQLTDEIAYFNYARA